MEKHIIHAVIVSTRPHLSEILTGFLILKEKGEIQFSYEFAPRFEKEHPYLSILFAEINGKKVVFDMMDGYDFSFEEIEEILSGCDYYFKRSFSSEQNLKFSGENRKKIIPWGLNYHVTCQNNPLDQKKGFREWKENLFQMAANGAKRSYFTPERFEGKPEYRKENKILFLARLWEPIGESKIDEERMMINKTRIELLRKLKKEYGNRLMGGLQFSACSRKIAPELVVPVSVTRRKQFLNTIKASDICIGTMGLFGSIGWKTAEYVAASRAIVNETLHYELPGDFSDGKNYLEFASVEQCMEQVSYLMEHPERIYEIKQENEAYYQTFVRPDQKMRRALRMISDLH